MVEKIRVLVSHQRFAIFWFSREPGIHIRGPVLPTLLPASTMHNFPILMLTDDSHHNCSAHNQTHKSNATELHEGLSASIYRSYGNFWFQNQVAASWDSLDYTMRFICSMLQAGRHVTLRSLFVVLGSTKESSMLSRAGVVNGHTLICYHNEAINTAQVNYKHEFK